MATVVKESEPLTTGPESARRLIVVAVGWILLAKAAGQLLGGIEGGFGFAIVLLYAVSIRGRIVGGGDRRLGLGVAPIARLPIIIGLSTIVVLYATLLDFIVYKYRPDLFFQSSSVPLWLTLFDSLVLIVLAPLAEELFFSWLAMDGTTEALGCAADGADDSCNVAAATS